MTHEFSARAIALLDVESKTQYGALIKAPFGAISSLTFLPGTSTLVTANPGANGAGSIVLWNLDPQILVQKACQAAGRDLTNAEWATYVPHYNHSPLCA